MAGLYYKPDLHACILQTVTKLGVRYASTVRKSWTLTNYTLVIIYRPKMWYRIIMAHTWTIGYLPSEREFYPQWGQHCGSGKFGRQFGWHHIDGIWWLVTIILFLNCNDIMVNMLQEYKSCGDLLTGEQLDDGMVRKLKKVKHNINLNLVREGELTGSMQACCFQVR